MQYPSSYFAALSVLLIFSLSDTLAQSATCTSVTGADLTFENEGDTSVRISVYDDTGTLVYPYAGGPSNLITVNANAQGCDWTARFGTSTIGNTASLPSGLLLFRFKVVGMAEEHYFILNPPLTGSDDFYHPFAATGSQNAHFRYYTGGSDREVLTSIAPLFSPLQFVDDFVGDTWVLPYNLDYVCAQPGAACSAPYTDWDVFITPLAQLPNPNALAYTFASVADVVLPDGYSWDWDEPYLTLRFPGSRFIIEGTLEAEDVTLTAATDWWEGIDIGIARDASTYPDASASFTDAVIEKIWKATKPNNAVRVHGAAATFSGTAIRESQFPFEGTDFSTGLVVEESTAYVIVDQQSQVRDHSGHGIAVYGGARLDLIDSVVSNNDGDGVHVAGGAECEGNGACVDIQVSRINDNAGSGVVVESGGEAEILQSEIALNAGDGVEVRSGATVYLFGDDITASETVGITDNVGVGIHASDYGSALFVLAGNEPVEQASNNPIDTEADVNIEGNLGGGLLATDHGEIQAGLYLVQDGLIRCPFGCLNTIRFHSSATGGTAPFDAKASTTSTIVAEYDYWGEGVTVASQLVLDEEAGSMIEVEPLFLTNPDAAARFGDPTPLVVAERSSSEWRDLLHQASVAAGQGDYDTAFVLLQEVLLLEDETGRQLAFADMTRLLQRAQPVIALSFLEALAAATSPDRPWALRALAFAYNAQDRPGEVERVTDSLIDDYAESPHALFGHLAQFRHRLWQSDSTGAETALRAAEAGWPEESEVRAARDLLMLVTGRVPTSEQQAFVSNVYQAAENTKDNFRLGVPYPNPSAGGVTVPLALGKMTKVKVAVFDMLGREVIRVAEEVFEPGAHRVTFDGTALPAGLYLVRATGDGFDTTRRIVVTR